MRRHPLASFFVLACVLSWLAWLPRIATEQGWWARQVPLWWHYLGAIGPVTAATIVTWRTEGRAAIRQLWQRYTVNAGSRGWTMAAASPLFLFALGATAARVTTGAWPASSEVAHAGNLPALGLTLTFLVHLGTFAIGEETGWRGFALPRLQAEYEALPATLRLTAAWAVWHVPSFFENPGYSGLGPGMLVGWAIGLVLGAVFLTWLFNSTSGSLSAVVLWHALFNTLIASEASDGLIAAVMTTGVMAMAVTALIVAGPRDLTGWSRRSGRRVTVPPLVRSTARSTAPSLSR